MTSFKSFLCASQYIVRLTKILIDGTVWDLFRTFLFFVNTGGDLVFMQCTPCTACFNQADPKFDPTKSSSYSPMPCTDPLCVDDLGLNVSCNSWASNTCEYNNTYGDQSFSGGNLAFETFTFPDTDGSTTSFPDVGFGCGTNQGRGNGNARGGRQPLDGVAGLGDGPLSLVSQLGPFIGNIFSYCLVSYGDSPNTTSPLLLGSAGDLPLAYTPLIKNTHYSALYYINLMGITVNNVAVDFPPGKIIPCSNFRYDCREIVNLLHWQLPIFLLRNCESYALNGSCLYFCWEVAVIDTCSIVVT